MQEVQNSSKQTSIFSCCCGEEKDKKGQINMLLQKKEKQTNMQSFVTFNGDSFVPYNEQPQQPDHKNVEESHVVQNKMQHKQEDVVITHVVRESGKPVVKFTYSNEPILPNSARASHNSRAKQQNQVIIRPLNAKGPIKILIDEQFKTPTKMQEKQGDKNERLNTTISPARDNFHINTVVRENQDKESKRRAMVSELMRKYSKGEINRDQMVAQSHRISVTLAQQP